MSKHTPGPWRCDPKDTGTIGGGTHYSGIYTDTTDGSIAYVIAYRHGEIEAHEANARLIASAPELLEALEAAAGTLEQLVRLNRVPENNAGLRKARAAIAKARGKS